MMKKSLFLMALLSFGPVCANNYTAVFHQNDGNGYRLAVGSIDSMNISSDEKFMSVSKDQSQSIRYGLSFLDSMVFTQSAAAVSDFPASSDFRNSFSEPFTTSYNNVEEVVVTDENSELYNDFVENYLYGSTVNIAYSGSSATVSGNYDKNSVSISVNGADVTVRSAKGKMRYVLSGSTSDGSFKIYSDKKFRLDLSGVNITNPTGAAINNQSGKSVYLVLTDGTANTLKDGTSYTMVTGEDQKGALFSEGQLLISGKGSLSVTSLSAHGICSDDFIRFRSNCGSVTVNAKKDGINTNDHLLVFGGNIDIVSEDDGISVDKGYISMQGGKVNVKSVDNGMVADYNATDTTHIDVAGGYISIETSGPKGHAVSTAGKMNITGGTIMAIVGGSASKCLSSDLDMVINNVTALLVTKGTSVYENLENSSAAAIRSRLSVSIRNSDIKTMSTGDGGKGLNVAGNIEIDGSKLTIVTTGSSFSSVAGYVRPRAVDATEMKVLNGSTLNISSSHTAIELVSGLYMSDSSIFAYSIGDSIKCLDVKGDISQNGGLLMYGIAK